MQVTAYEGVIENGQIKLKPNVTLPEKTKVYVIIPSVETQKTVHIYSPRLVHSKQIADFQKEIVEELPNADV